MSKNGVNSADLSVLSERRINNLQILLTRFAFLVYDEMLHLKYPVKVHNGRRCVHGAALQAEESLFPHLEQAKAFLKKL